MSVTAQHDKNQHIGILEDQRHLAASMTARVEAVNAHAATATVTGCRFPVFTRRFRHCVGLGGRLYAVGTDNCQNIRKAERRAMTINGEPVAEVDIHASFLTIFLALTGAAALPDGDLYALDGQPRGAVKAFLTQSFGSGTVRAQWSHRQPPEVLATDAKAIKAAALRAYPALGNLRSTVPADLASRIQPSELRWAVGQYLTFRESEAVLGALEYVRRQGGMALPLHDALLVPVSSVALARSGLEGAFFTLIGIRPRINVHRFG